MISKTYQLKLRRAQCTSIAAGADEFLLKPISADTLLEMIRSRLNLNWIYEVDKSSENPMTDLVLQENYEVQGSQEMTMPSTCTLERIYDHVKKCDLDSILD